MIKDTIFIEPVGKARPRMARRGNKVITYTPQKTAHAENIIRDHVMAQQHQFFGKDIPLVLVATFYRPRPKHLPKRFIFPTTRPDWDNYGKLLADSLEAFVYANDSQITTALIQKRFGSPPRIELIIEEEAKVDEITKMVLDKLVGQGEIEPLLSEILSKGFIKTA